MEEKSRTFHVAMVQRGASESFNSKTLSEKCSAKKEERREM